MTRDRSARDRLIETYLPWAQRIAARLYRLRIEQTCAFDDYLQYARLGLMEAIERFDPRRQVPFEAFSGHRIRGAVFNGLVRESEAAAQRHRARTAERVLSLSNVYVVDPQRATLDDFVDLTVGLAFGLLLEDDEHAPQDESSTANPYAATEIDQLRTRVRAMVQRLPERERDIIHIHYYEQFEFQAIAEQWGLTKGRVSQLHARALHRLRELLQEQPSIDRKL